MEGIVSTRSTESCYRCAFFERELRNKDETILKLQDKLRQIHETSRATSNNSHPQEGTKINITSVNFGLDLSVPRVRRGHCSETDTGSDMDSLSQRSSVTVNDGWKQTPNTRRGNGEVNVTLQEIIDKVIDGSPKQKRLNKSTRYNRGEDKVFMESLLRKLNAAVESSDIEKMGLDQTVKVSKEHRSIRSPLKTKARVGVSGFKSKPCKRSFCSSSDSVVMSIQSSSDQTSGSMEKTFKISNPKLNTRSQQASDTAQNLQNHLGLVKANTFLCPFCNRFFSRSFNLQFHIKGTHLHEDGKDDNSSKDCQTTRTRCKVNPTGIN